LFGKSISQLPDSQSPHPVNDILQQAEEVRDAETGQLEIT
jgi:hypothetical protein